ncbi:MAG: peptidase domain-containing ABC transporter [Ectothiorhodospiraceae bacterium AqS1]|nr:peptidase domain-containing ABC transporter [Ectothiorhodospiraceae bacterium AqS1]MBF2761643.1 peptidase domain-containing ABC transporter [Ectothiorhodospiraceae bacterium AqS1]
MFDNNEGGREIPLSWFITTLRRYVPLYAELFVVAIFLRLIGLLEPFIFQVIIDRVLPFQREATLIVIVSIFIAASLFQMAFGTISDLLSILTSNRVTRELGWRIFEHLFKLPYMQFRLRPVGETIARVEETDTIRNFLVGSTMGTFLDIMFLAVYLSVLFFLSEQLALIVLVSLPLQFLIYFSFGPFIRRRLRVQFDTGAKHQNVMVESITGAASIKALSAEKEILKQIDKNLNDNLHASYRVRILSIFSENLTFIINQGVKIAIIYYGANLVFSGNLTLGQLIAFHLLSARVTGPIAKFARLWEDWQNVKISRQRLGDIVNVPMELFNELPELPKNIKSNLEFCNVYFSYGMGNPLILKEFNFEFKQNSLTLIIGPSGIGKSTFGRLAAGIESPLIGEILLGGENIAKYDPHDVRMRIAYISQDSYLFSGTIRNNLIIGEEKVSDKDIEWALKKSAADTLIESLPNGLNTEVGERGSALSGGQRQRIAIARSILKKPKVIILDEPTSSLDDVAQKKMAKELNSLKETATIIVITHRPGIFEQPDQIVDFENMS